MLDRGEVCQGIYQTVEKGSDKSRRSREVIIFQFLIKDFATKRYGGMGVYIHEFLNSAVRGDEWSASHSGHLTPAEMTPGHNGDGGVFGSFGK
jgi:hypothetical protein